VGCFGGMSIAAGLCSALVVTREARLGLNGPAVIEQEAGIGEYDSRDRPFIWGLTGGEQRFATGLADRFVDDDAVAMRDVVAELVNEPVNAPASDAPRSERYDAYLQRIDQYTAHDAIHQPDPAMVRRLYGAQP